MVGSICGDDTVSVSGVSIVRIPGENMRDCSFLAMTKRIRMYKYLSKERIVVI